MGTRALRQRDPAAVAVSRIAARREALYIRRMCGRIIQSSGPELPGLKVILGTPDDSRIRKPRYNGAPSQDLIVIRRHPETGENTAEYAWSNAKL